jgi:hypothetical protein
MNKRWLAIFALAAALAFATPAVMAGHGQGKGHGKGNPHAAKHADDHGWERRGAYEYQTFDRDARPPGWSKGNKTGWGNCGLPPGQAKKYGCRSYVYEGRRYYYYQEDGGRIIIRRPVISIHGGVDVH